VSVFLWCALRIAGAGGAAPAAGPDSGLGRAAAEGRPVTGELVTALALSGEEVARSVLGLTGERLGAGLVSLANAFDPEVIVVGGGVMAAGELLLGPARSVLARRALPPIRARVRVVPARFGDDAGLIGAGLAAFEVARGG
jgi:glucokinase